MLHFLIGLGLSVSSCLSGLKPSYQHELDQKSAEIDFPLCRFAVLSDLHYYDPELGTSGKAYFNDVLSASKLFHLSSELLLQALSELKQEKSLDFIIICGDLTKDGERFNHQRLAEHLSQLEKAGIDVYVIPGNHDIANPLAKSYLGLSSQKIDSITPLEFASIYAPFGYAEAISRDRDSLSYIAEPIKGLWLFALDSTTYYKNIAKQMTSAGYLKESTLCWLEEKLEQARALGKMAIGMIHHGLLEHFRGQKKYFPAFVIDNSERVANILACKGLKLLFSGHFHAQDITLKRINAHHFVFDIETSSLITYPHAYRLVDLEHEDVQITTRSITNLASLAELRLYSFSILWNSTYYNLKNRLKPYGLSSSDLLILLPQVAYALANHFRGDEESPPPFKTDGLSLQARLMLFFIDDLIQGVRQDLPPPDNNLAINAKNGDFRSIH